MLPPAETTLADAAFAAEETTRALLAETREAVLRVAFSPSLENALLKRNGLPAAALRSWLGDRLYREDRALFARAFEPGRLDPGRDGGAAAFALAGPPPSWQGGLAEVRVRTWDPGDALLPSLLAAAAAGLADCEDPRVADVECEAIRRVDPAGTGDRDLAAGVWALRFEASVQLRERVVAAGVPSLPSEARRRRFVPAAEVGPGRVARAAWLRLAELSRGWGAVSGVRMEPRFADSPVFAALAAGLDAVAPAPGFEDVSSSWSSRRQGRPVELCGFAGRWPAEGAWPVEEAAAALGSEAERLLGALWRAAAWFQIGCKTVYGCGAVRLVGEGLDEVGKGAGSGEKSFDRRGNRARGDEFLLDLSLADRSESAHSEIAL